MHCNYYIAFITLHLLYCHYYIAFITLHVLHCIYCFAFIMLYLLHCLYYIAFIVLHCIYCWPLCSLGSKSQKMLSSVQFKLGGYYYRQGGLRLAPGVSPDHSNRTTKIQYNVQYLLNLNNRLKCMQLARHARGVYGQGEGEGRPSIVSRIQGYASVFERQ